MINWLFRRYVPELVRCEKCGMVIGYNRRIPGEKTLHEYRTEHDRICLLSEPGTPLPTSREGEPPAEFDPEEEAEFLRLVDAKRSTLIQEITIHVNRTTENDEQSRELLRTIVPFLMHPIMGVGPSAMHRAYLIIVTHLVERLAAERSEPASWTWQREAADMAREDGQRGE